MRQYYNVNVDELKIGDTISPSYQEIQILEVHPDENIVVFILVNVLGGSRQPQYDTRYRLTRDEFLSMLQRMGPVDKKADIFGAGLFMASEVQAVLAITAYVSTHSDLYRVTDEPPF